MPLTLLHVTALYSNAVLTAILPPVNDFAKTMELPVSIPIVQSQVAEFRVNPIEGHVGGGLFLTNHFVFMFDNGYVNGFRAPTNFFYDESFPLDISKYTGKDNITTNEAIELCRTTLKKLGYDVEELNANKPPESVRGSFDTKDGHHIPQCEIRWSTASQTEQDRTNAVSLEFQINMETKRVEGMNIFSPKLWRANPVIDVVPETEKEFRMKHPAKMFVNTNAPKLFKQQ